MKEVQISLDSIEKVRDFVNLIAKFNTDFDITSGTKTIDAKSIVGILTLNLSKPMDLTIRDNDNMDEILKAIDTYIVK
jgi:phosphotransferase system HPr-like phosphotransfer protein